VLPGVAHVGYLIQALDRGNWRAPVLAAIGAGLPTLGICAGFQLLCARSEEAPELPGLGIFSGTVARLRGEKIPHMGWSRVEATTSAFESGWAYFAHSYAPPAALRERWRSRNAAPRLPALPAPGTLSACSFIPNAAASTARDSCNASCAWRGSLSMPAKRIIACLDVKNGRVVKGVRFEGLRDAGDPASCALRYCREGSTSW